MSGVIEWVKNIPLDELNKLSSREFGLECFRRGMDIVEWPMIMMIKNIRIFGSLENYVIDLLESPCGYKYCLANPTISPIEGFLHTFNMALNSSEVSDGTKNRIRNAIRELLEL